MLFVDLHQEGDRPSHLEFHPRVTVVTGLGDDGRRRLAALLGGIVRGDVPDGARLRIDARGNPHEATPALLAELGLTSGVDVDPVVRAEDLPGARVPEASPEPQPEPEPQPQPDPEPEEEAVPEAVALADRLDALERDLAAVPPPVAAPAVAPHLLEEARTRLEEARAEVATAEAAVNPQRLGPDDIAALEAAHDAVMAAEERAERRLSGPGAKRRLAEAREEEQVVLARLGLGSYGEYLLRTSTLMVDSNAPVRLAQANSALADAEAVWEELAAGGVDADAAQAADAERTRLADEIADVRARAVALLGGEPDGDLAAALRDLRRPVVREPFDQDEPQPEPPPPTQRHTPTVDLSAVERVPLEVYCLARVAAQRDVGSVGPCPIVVDGAFDDAGADCRQAALDLLERFSPMVQVVYLTDDPKIVEWANELGDAAAVRRA